MKKNYPFLLFIFVSVSAYAQVPGAKQATPSLKIPGSNFDYFDPKEYIIGEINITGTKFLDKGVLVSLSKLSKGDKIVIPGDATASALKNLWAQGLFEDIQISIDRIVSDSVYLNIAVVERPRLGSINIVGLSKSKVTDLNEKLKDKSEKIINSNLYTNTRRVVTSYLSEKGFYFAKVDFKTTKDPAVENSQNLEVIVDKGNRTKVHEINFSGNKNFSAKKLRKWLKKTKQQAFYKVFGSGKFDKVKYEEDKKIMIAKMHEKGYRDASILSDSIYAYNDKSVGIKINLYEGPKYYFGNVSFVGNAKYPTKILEQVLQIKKGDVYDQERLEKKLVNDPKNGDLNSVYTNDGYLTFNAEPLQKRIYNDTVDLEIRIVEGQQFTNNRIILKGNTVTNARVVERSIDTKPGEKFRKDDIINSVRKIGQLGNFDESKTVPTPKPNVSDGTVDLYYEVAEKPSDQVELSAGFGGGRFIGTLGLTFNNFSLRNLFNKESTGLLPRGDGQRLSLRGQSNGRAYQSYSFSFTEPWLGGTKPVSLSVSAFTSLNNVSTGLSADGSTYRRRIRMNGVSVGIGKQLAWPDRNFVLSHTLNLQQYVLDNYPGYVFSTGTSYNLNFQEVLSRDSRDSPFFPKSGSYFRFTLQLTPPYSLFNKVNYATASDKDRYKFSEYHKWKFEGQWFQTVVGNFVLKAQAQFGFLGQYNKSVGSSPFERFKLGGDGMMGFDFLQGTEVIAMRGYANNAVIPLGANIQQAQLVQEIHLHV